MPEEKFNFKKILMAAASLFILVLIVFFIIMSLNEWDKRTYAGPDVLTISAAGQGEVFVKPDIAQISFTIQKEKISLLDAQNEASVASNKLTNFLKSSGIEEKDIKTTNYSISPRYDYLENTGRIFRGYDVSETIEVKIRKIDDTGKILSGAANNGADQVGQVSFTIDDQEAVKRQAREKAIIDAKQKADKLANDLGLKIVRLVGFYESGGDYYPVAMMKESSSVLGMGGGIAPSIPTGENKVTINVSLTYQMK